MAWGRREGNARGTEMMEFIYRQELMLINDPDPPTTHACTKEKGGKDQRLASSYRPNSLLQTIGKMLEKCMTLKMTYHLESTKSLNDRQHSFREGKSVDTAINELLSKIKSARRDGKHVLVLSIDIKGAFDNLLHRAILKSLGASAWPGNINKLPSLLQNRKVTLLTPRGRATKEQKQGCPQGSCSGPALWNLVANEILNQVWPDNVHIQAFANDFVLVIKADTNKSLVENTQSEITQFSSWCLENELAISTEKQIISYSVKW
ncbi:Retrovirus-related Pol polyprotein from type-1 retrotransposable element R1 [Araneus ventricosus]|uniref:Retrovirus-related Pol polyprotein from type-1 retrotransposable element R1 n=1 Tax=Araneus ventricosus TaxID=182803 RepID=A0A4Y2EI75_ARAVE|nr:Retrovirus-related Pol polyprotein from type-1 retrotransposable element R1 [Araneus ventricosus]